MNTSFACLIGAVAAFGAVSVAQAAPVTLNDGLRVESHADLMRTTSVNSAFQHGLTESQSQVATDETVAPAVTMVQYYHNYYRHRYYHRYYHHYYRHGIFIR